MERPAFCHPAGGAEQRGHRDDPEGAEGVERLRRMAEADAEPGASPGQAIAEPGDGVQDARARGERGGAEGRQRHRQGGGRPHAGQRDGGAEDRRHRGEVRGPVDQHQGRRAGEGPPGLAPEPAGPDQFPDPARGHRHGEAGDEVQRVPGQGGRQAQPPGAEMPAQRPGAVVRQRQRQQQDQVSDRQTGDGGTRLLPPRFADQKHHAERQQRDEGQQDHPVPAAARGTAGRRVGEEGLVGHHRRGLATDMGKNMELSPVGGQPCGQA